MTSRRRSGSLRQNEAVLIVHRVPVRGVRVSAALAALETVVALGLAHRAAGGELPDPLWLALAGVPAYAAGLLVLRRRATIGSVLPALVGLQLVLHGWLVTLAGPTGHAHGAAPEVVLGLTGPMVAAHLVAAVVTGAVWHLRRRAVEVLIGWVDRGVLVAPVVARRPVRSSYVVGAGWRIAAALPTRGPPVAAGA